MSPTSTTQRLGIRLAITTVLAAFVTFGLALSPVLTPKAAAAPAVNCAVAKCVALTFDDGPGPFTGRLASQP